ncbi:TetR/AcrR family transcriptional regulator [Piscinibacter sp. HJYY11]|uniref:TetR/AcrR family transcriptional regulator n=1 Tax=Piscinibacter sp. HJYY11 TaxID=2801333 RepID=UPI00191FD484|nr:TetR/AcrR family transcriptional regulator [Piscinibacter sp. HJYY11]MBL0727370.1 TetR/AcrR family transcriptional regulator [Piscinibacter sp. HJYY11]
MTAVSPLLSMATARRKQTTSSAARPTVEPATGEKKRRYHHGNLRTALLVGASHLLRTSGIEGVTLRACAQFAGVSQAAIRNHFADKNHLLASLAAEGFVLLGQRRKSQATLSGSIAETLEIIFQNYVGFAVENSHLFRLMFADKNLRRDDYADLRSASHHALKELHAIFSAMLERAKLDSSGIEGLTFNLWSAMHGLAMLVIDEQYTLVTHPSVVKAQCTELATMLAAGLEQTRKRPKARVR